MRSSSLSLKTSSGLPWRRILGLCAVLITMLCVAGWHIAKSRSYQFFGDIVPRVEMTEPFVVLSFDDGPTPNFTDEILAILAQHGVKASFFVTGESLQRFPELGKKIVDAGHELGNHSFSHRRMWFMDYDEVQREVEATQKLILKAGQEEPIYFRPPYGKKWINLPLYLSLNGITTAMWDVEPESDKAIAKDAEGIAQHVLEQVKPGSIVLLHVMYKSRRASMQAVPMIIESLSAKGYQFVTLGDLIAHSSS